METGLDFADFLIGAPSSYTQGQAGAFYNRNLYLAAFARTVGRRPIAHRELRRALGAHPSLGRRSSTNCRRW